MVVVPEARLAKGNDCMWCGCRGLLEDFCDDDSIHVEAIHDTPNPATVCDAQLVAAWPDPGHRPRVWQRELLALLQQPQQIARFQPRSRREWR